MGRFIFISMIVVVLVLFVSCQVSPEQALENIQNPKIEYKTTIKVPVMATSVNVGDYISSAIERIEEELPGIDIEEGSPMVLKYSTTTVLVSKDEFSDVLSDVSGQMDIDINVESPDIEGFSQTIEVDMPRFSPVESTFNVPYLPSGEYTTPSQSSDIDTGLTSAKLRSFTVSGSIDIGVTLPDTWTDVEVLSISATITDGNGNVVYTGTISGSSGSLNLTSKTFEVGSGKITVEYSLTFNSASVHTEGGNVTVTITPNLRVEKLSGLKIDFSKEINLPENVENLVVKSGKIVISSAEVSFTSVSGSIEYEGGTKSISVEDGNLVVDLSNVSLPATVSIDTVDVDLNGNINSINLNGDFENVIIGTVTILNSDLSVEGSQSVDLPEEVKLIKDVKIESGQLVLEYDSKIPVDINVHVHSPDFEPDLDWSFTISANSSGIETYDLSGKSIIFEGDTFDVYYSASPVGYDGEKITLNDISLDQDFTLDATFSYGDLEISQVTVGGTKVEYEDSLDLSETLREFTDLTELLSYFDMSATLVSSVEMDGTITLNATAYKGESSENYSVEIPVSGSELSLDDLIGVVKDILEFAPERIDYSVGVDVDQLTLDLSTDVSFKIDAEVPLIAHFDEKTLVFSYATNVKIDLPEEASVLESATLLIEGTNTTGFAPIVEVYVSGEKSAELDFSSSIDGYVTISGEDLEKLSTDGLDVEFKVYLDGDQVISTQGGIEVIAKLEADVKIVTGGGE